MIDPRERDKSESADMGCAQTEPSHSRRIEQVLQWNIAPDIRFDA